jgi:hypothetical protein
MLTGLDQLADIAESCGQFTHGARRFLKYGKDNGLDQWGTKFTDAITKSEEKATKLKYDLPEKRSLGVKTLVTDLKQAATSASAVAGSHLVTLKSEITTAMDTATTEGRTSVHNAVNSARVIVNQSPKSISLFEAWAALKEAKDAETFINFSDAIDLARKRLNKALSWHEKQNADHKFRLKALAAQFYVPPHEHSGPALCPLCTALLTSAEQQELAVQLAELQQDAAEAECKLDDVCLNLEADLVALLPTGLKKHRDFLTTMEPKTSYSKAICERFCEAAEFSDTLIGLSEWVKAKVLQQESALPSFDFAPFRPAGDVPISATALHVKLYGFDRLSALVSWWSENRDNFRVAWLEIIG